MSSTSMKHRAFFGLTVLFGLFACVAGIEHSDVPPQSWWEGHGAVVPHDSFPADCRLCHLGDDWQTIKDDFAFDHAKETAVPLVGAHAQAACLRCHNDRGPVATFAARGCAGCHEDVHRSQLGGECGVCHNERDWRPSEQIALHNRTRFPLVGSHAAVACFRCHVGSQVGNFTGVDPRCESCHQDELSAAQSPNHLSQGWTSNCDDCHIPTTWKGAGFTHTSWALTGKHKTADCTQCHTGASFTGAPTQCVGCHQAEYNSTTDPNHAALNISTTCQQCHGTNGWSGASFNHVGISNGCVTCHQADYNGTTSPNHVASGFPTNCEACHNTNTWNTANFNHAGITSGCVACHQADYDATNDPNHLAAGFPTSCETCHNKTNWDNANFNHSFPINSGNHANLQCSDCHEQPSNFMSFTCISCHEHNQSSMNSEHDDVNGYIYQSSACLNCHPTGHE